MKCVNILIGDSSSNKILIDGIITVMILLLIMHMLYDVWYGTFCLNNRGAEAHKLCMHGKLCDCLSSWSNTRNI